jgi:hypothetical protein
MGSDDDDTKYSRRKRLRRLYTALVVPRTRSIPLLLGIMAACGILSFLGLWSFRHSQCYSREAGVHWKPAPIIDIPRPCPSPDYAVVADPHNTAEKPVICLTTLTDRQSPSVWQRLVRCRDFDGVARLSFPNLRAYAAKYGYRFTDASDLMDTSRPPAWSKILAVQKQLQAVKDDACDWVFWVDADIVVMNSTIDMKSFLPSDPAIDLLITMDRRLTANSGAWLIRNTDWSKSFLQTWWNMRSWVREPGLSLSGDNAAFGHLIEENMQRPDDASRIRMAPRCTFNSFAVFEKEGESSMMEDQDWYLSQNFYHRGDFMAHASGVDHKEACITMLLEKSV